MLVRRKLFGVEKRLELLIALFPFAFSRTVNASIFCSILEAARIEIDALSVEWML